MRILLWWLLLLPALACGLDVPSDVNCGFWTALLADPRAPVPSLTALHPELAAEVAALIDVPYQARANKRPQAEKRVETAVRNWNNASLTADERAYYAKEAAGYWLFHATKALAARKDLGAVEKVILMKAVADLIRERATEPGAHSRWDFNLRRTSQGHYVFAGPVHRIVILNEPGAPLARGEIPDGEPIGASADYYWDWSPYPMDVRGLSPIP